MKNLIIAALASLVSTIAIGKNLPNNQQAKGTNNCPVSISKEWIVEVDRHNYSLGGKVVAVSGDCKLLTIEDNFVSKGTKDQNVEKIEDVYFPRPDICKGKNKKIVCEPDACISEGNTTICWANRVHIKGKNIQNGFVAGINRYKNKVAIQYVDADGELQDEAYFASPSELFLDITQPEPWEIADVVDEDKKP